MLSSEVQHSDDRPPTLTSPVTPPITGGVSFVVDGGRGEVPEARYNDRVRTFVFALLLATPTITACGGSRALPDPIDLYEANYGGTVPVEADVVYVDGAEVALCDPPAWTSLHPDRNDVEWPIVRVGTIEEATAVHANTPNLAGPVFVAFNSDLMETTGGILAVTTWSGSDVRCGDATLERGATVVVGGYFDHPIPAGTFDRLSSFVEDGAPSPWDDLDVAVNAGTTPDL